MYTIPHFIKIQLVRFCGRFYCLTQRFEVLISSPPYVFITRARNRTPFECCKLPTVVGMSVSSIRGS